MSASRAYIAGLGTTGVLVASSILLLFVVGAVVAFNTSSVSDGIRQLEGLIVDRDEPVGLGGPALAAAEAAPTAGGVSARPPASAAPARPREGTATAGSAAPASAGTAAPFAPRGGVPQGSPNPRAFRSPRSLSGGGGRAQQRPSPSRGPAISPTSELTRSAESLGQTTEGITTGLGDVVGGVDPRLGQTVKGLGQTTGQLVDGLTGTVDGLTGRLIGR